MAEAAVLDRDMLVLRDAGNAVTEIDIRYRVGDINVKRELRDAREQAFAAYSLARLALLRDGILTTEKDLEDMRDLKRQIDEAGDTQDLIVAVLQLVQLFVKLGI